MPHGPYYTESEWNDSKGLLVTWVFRQGEPRHFAVFYDKKRADEYVSLLNHIEKRHFDVMGGYTLGKPETDLELGEITPPSLQ